MLPGCYKQSPHQVVLIGLQRRVVIRSESGMTEAAAQPSNLESGDAVGQVVMIRRDGREPWGGSHSIRAQRLTSHLEPA
jgi:hypothetical protein